VLRVLREALRSGRLAREAHDSYAAAFREARAVAPRLPPARRAEVRSVVGVVERLAAARRLTPDRMEPVFLTLRRNTEFWRLRSFPAAGARVTFQGSPVVFQYYRGRGLQLHPLANFGRANALARPCRAETARPGVRCRSAALRAMLDAMSALAVDRGGFTAWEYYFAWAAGAPPWVSGIAQGTAVQALARGSEVLGEPAYLELGRSALGAFEAAPPLGVSVPADGGSHYLLYSFDPALRVLNGTLQAVVGLHDFGRIAEDPRALALFQAGETAARAAVPRHDTGAWSLYAVPGRESTVGYHQLVRDFLSELCDRTGTATYCKTARRFSAYLDEKPRLEYLGSPGARAKRRVRVRFRLSKLSRVSLRVHRGGRLVHAQEAWVPYGLRYLAWTPRTAGRYSVRLRAIDQLDHPTERRAAMRVRRARRG
jgi:hypothetical protein